MGSKPEVEPKVLQKIKSRKKGLETVFDYGEAELDHFGVEIGGRTKSLTKNKKSLASREAASGAPSREAASGTPSREAASD